MTPPPTANLLRILAGEWIGTGRGEYPTIPSVEYTDSIRFVLDETRPRLFYEQQAQFRPCRGQGGADGPALGSGFSARRIRLADRSQQRAEQWPHGSAAWFLRANANRSDHPARKRVLRQRSAHAGDHAYPHRRWRRTALHHGDAHHQRRSPCPASRSDAEATVAIRRTFLRRRDAECHVPRCIVY